MSDSNDRRDNSLLNMIYDAVKTNGAVAQENSKHIVEVKTEVTTLKQDNRDQWDQIKDNTEKFGEHKVDHPNRVSAVQWAGIVGAMAAASTAAVALAHALGLGTG